jgi:hypothetical protein
MPDNYRHIFDTVNRELSATARSRNETKSSRPSAEAQRQNRKVRNEAFAVLR